MNSIKQLMFTGLQLERARTELFEVKQVNKLTISKIDDALELVSNELSRHADGVAQFSVGHVTFTFTIVANVNVI